MGGAQSVAVTVTNLSDKTILYKYLTEKPYVEEKETAVKGRVGACGATVGAEITDAKKYDNRKAPLPGLSRLEPGQTTKLTLELKGSKIAYVTIQPEGEKPIWDNLQQDKKRNIVIEKDLQIIDPDDKDLPKVQPKIQTQPPESGMNSQRMATASEESKEQQKVNGVKFGLLLKDVGTATLRDLFLKEKSIDDLTSTIKTNSEYLLSLMKKRKITEEQYGYLCKESQPDISRFDISLMCMLLRDEKFFPHFDPPERGWEAPILPESDKTPAAHILRLKKKRNYLAHIPSMEIPTDDYKLIEEDLVHIILEIARYVGEDATARARKGIDKVRARKINLDEEEIKRIINKYSSDLCSTISNMKNDFSRIETLLEDHDIKERGQMSKLQEGVLTIREEVTELKVSDKEQKDDLDFIKAELREIRSLLEKKGRGRIRKDDFSRAEKIKEELGEILSLLEKKKEEGVLEKEIIQWRKNDKEFIGEALSVIHSLLVNEWEDVSKKPVQQILHLHSHNYEGHEGHIFHIENMDKPTFTSRSTYSDVELKYSEKKPIQWKEADNIPSIRGGNLDPSAGRMVDLKGGMDNRKLTSSSTLSVVPSGANLDPVGSPGTQPVHRPESVVPSGANLDPVGSPGTQPVHRPEEDSGHDRSADDVDDEDDDK